MPNGVHNRIDDDGTILSVVEDDTTLSLDNTYILATRAEGCNRSTFIFVSSIISASLGIIVTLLVQPIIYELAGQESAVLSNHLIYLILPLAGLWGGYKYYKKRRGTNFTKAEFLQSAKSAILSIFAVLFIAVVCFFALSFFLVLAIIIVCFRTAKSIFKG